MLAIFKKGLADPPEELNSPVSLQASVEPKLPQETLNDFLSSHPTNSFSVRFEDKALLAYAPPDRSVSIHQRLFCGLDDIYCIFLGGLNNLSALNKQYGLSKGANEAMFVIEAYRTLRDRGPYPAHQVLNDLDGSFGFVIYDTKAGTVFTALGADEGVKLFWGIGADGSGVICDNLEVIKACCAKSFAPFPTGCKYHSKGGLMSFEHPMNKMKAMQRIDSFKEYNEQVTEYPGAEYLRSSSQTKELTEQKNLRRRGLEVKEPTVDPPPQEQMAKANTNVTKSRTNHWDEFHLLAFILGVAVTMVVYHAFNRLLNG